MNCQIITSLRGRRRFLAGFLSLTFLTLIASAHGASKSQSLLRLDPDALLRGSAKLRRSGDSGQKVFGWSAASVAVQQVHLSKSAACRIEQEALEAQNVAALDFLRVLYKREPWLPTMRLANDATPSIQGCTLPPRELETASYVALIDNAPGNATNPASSAELQSVIGAVKNSSTLPSFIESDQYRSLSSTARGVLAIVAIQGHAANTPISLVAAVRDCAAENQNAQDALRAFLARYCAIGSAKTAKETNAELRGAAPTPVLAVPSTSWQPGATDILRIGDQLQLYGEAKAMSGACPVSHFSQTWNGRVSVPVPDAGILTGSSGRMLQGGHGEGGGAIFEPIISGAKEADTPTPNLVAYGVRHRTWGQSGRLHFGMQITYKPSIGTIAVASRFRRVSFSDNPNACSGLTLPQVRCTSGCLNSNLVELGTTWEVLPLSGDEVTIELEFDGCADYFAPCAGAKGAFLIGSKIFEETLQVVEIGSSRHNDFAKLDPLVLTQVDANHPQNPLLSYVASLAQESQPGGWLIPENNRSEIAAAQSEIHLSLLKRLADRSETELETLMQPELKDSSTEAYRRSPWRERHRSLAALWPLIRYRTGSYYRISLASGIAAGSVGILELQNASKDLGVALTTLNRASTEDLRRSIVSSKKTLGVGDTPIAGNDRELLETAVVGASASVDSALEELLVLQAQRCNEWSNLEWSVLPDDNLRRETDSLCNK